MPVPSPRLALAATGVLFLGAIVLMSRAENPAADAPIDSLTDSPAKSDSKMSLATFGSGCFWCTEAVFVELDGVRKVVSGYSGGAPDEASYTAVSTGRTGHAEVIQVEYDPSLVDYATLLEVFWKTHDPTTPNQQGADKGPQYRSVVFYHDDQQKALAEEYKAKLDKSGAFRAPIVTEISPFTKFYPAEGYHQSYFANNPHQPYCQAVIGPKLQKFRDVFGDKLKNAKKKDAAKGATTTGAAFKVNPAELKERLTPLQYKVTQQAGTERPFENEYWDNKQVGDYRCVVCGELLFKSDAKFDSGCGWPSFTAPADGKAITEHEDKSMWMARTEIRCSKCQAHLGHVFDDGPKDAGGLRYCLNSAAMQFKGGEKVKEEPKKEAKE